MNIQEKTSKTKQCITGKYWEDKEILTTLAPSPSTALRAKSGTGSQEGRPKTDPNCSHISPSRTGFGAVPLITPDIWTTEDSVQTPKVGKEILTMLFHANRKRPSTRLCLDHGFVDVT